MARRGVALGALGLALALLPATAGATDWSQFHSTVRRTGLSTSTAIDRKSVPSMGIVWSAATGPTEEGINSSPAVVDGIAYVGSDDGRLWAFDAATGAVVWSRATEGQVRSAPGVDGGLVIVGSSDGTVRAFDAFSGEPRWSYPLGGTITAAPLILDGVVYIGSRGGTFVALERDTGSLLWRQKPWSVWASASAGAGKVYVASDQSMLFAYDADTGALVWKSQGDARLRSAPSVRNGRVFVGSDAGTVTAYSTRDGSRLWRTRAAPAETNTVVRSAPAVWNGRVIVTTGETTPMDGHVVALDAAIGVEQWRAKLADYSTSSPAVANGVVYLGSYDTRLYAFAGATGKELWTSGWGTLPRGLNSSPAVAAGNVYVGCRDGSLYAFGLGSVATTSEPSPGSLTRSMRP
jgi:outer membrane protein assembly factor BamB